jgi:uncharacterized protein YjiS (DUF1127 family)
MINYYLWMSNDPRLNAIEATRNEASVGRFRHGWQQMERAFQGTLALALRAGRSLPRARAQRAAIAELRGLDDRRLKDIGISRSQITGIVRGTCQATRTADGEAEPRTGQARRGAVTAAIESGNKCDVVALNTRRGPLSDGARSEVDRQPASETLTAA